MKIALLCPDVADCFPPYAPVNLAYLAGQLEGIGEDVLILDLNIQRDWKKRLFAFDPDFVGITAIAFSFQRCLKLIKLINKRSTAKIILGGPQATVFQEELFKYPGIDYLFYGEADHSIREFFLKLENKQSLTGVNGLIYREGNKIIKNPPREFEYDLDSLPRPAWHLLELSRYISIPVVTSRGCSNRCIFCAVGSIQGHCFRGRSAESVAAEIAYLNSRFGRSYFTMAGDNFMEDRARVMEICRKIKERRLGINWSVTGSRVDLVDKDLLENMKDAGCYALAFGIESGSSRILNLINKGISTAQVEQAVRLAKGAGMDVYGSFMIGNPGETEETVGETLQFSQRLFDAGLSPRWSHFNLATPYPRTELWDWVKKNGTFLIKDPLNFPSHIQFKHVRPVFETPQFTRLQRIKVMKKAWRLWRRACRRQAGFQFRNVFRGNNRALSLARV